MITYDIVYIKGNPLSGSVLQHNLINNSIFELIKKYSYNIIESNAKNLSGITLPKARIYIGFSRGSRYFKKLDNNSLKISIGGISASKVHLFRNKDDNILLGDISNSSMQAHFIISDDDKIKIKTLIDNHLNK